MRDHAGWGKFFLASAGVAVLAVLVVAGMPTAVVWSQATTTQSPAVPQWQIAAGGKMAFDVASVKLDTAAPTPQTVHWNIPPDSMGAFNPTGGLYSATNMPLVMYIAFAYKLAEPEANSLRNSLPKWTNTVRYDIEAHAAAGTNPTKDQYRLMMQALLADRFKLAIHYETKQMPVMALVVDKPGKLGPRLQPHATDAPCSTAPPTFKNGLPITVAGGFPEWCGTLSGWRESGLLHVGGRDLDLESVVKVLCVQSTGIDRPVLDRTGLRGKYDFVMEFSPSVNPLPDVAPPFDQSGPPFQEALKAQLGLKLVPMTGPSLSSIMLRSLRRIDGIASGPRQAPRSPLIGNVAGGPEIRWPLIFGGYFFRVVDHEDLYLRLL